MRGVCGSPFPRWAYFLYYTSIVFEMEPSLPSRKPMEGALPRKGHVARPDERQLHAPKLRGGRKIREPAAPSEKHPSVVGGGSGEAKNNFRECPLPRDSRLQQPAIPAIPPRCFSPGNQPAAPPWLKCAPVSAQEPSSPRSLPSSGQKPDSD